jgi:hypothetical protein
MGNRILVPLLSQLHWQTFIVLFDCYSFQVVAYTNTVYIGRQRKQPYTKQKVSDKRCENICLPTALRPPKQQWYV